MLRKIVKVDAKDLTHGNPYPLILGDDGEIVAEFSPHRATQSQFRFRPAGIVELGDVDQIDVSDLDQWRLLE